MVTIDQLTNLMHCESEKAWRDMLIQLARDLGFDSVLFALAVSKHAAFELPLCTANTHALGAIITVRTSCVTVTQLSYTACQAVFQSFGNEKFSTTPNKLRFTKKPATLEYALALPYPSTDSMASSASSALQQTSFRAPPSKTISVTILAFYRWFGTMHLSLGSNSILTFFRRNRAEIDAMRT